MGKAVKLTFARYNEAIVHLAKSIKMHGQRYDSIYPVARGGYYPAIRLSQILHLPIIADRVEKNALVVDNESVTGKTISVYKDNDTAVVFCTAESLSKCSYHGIVTQRDTLHIYPDERVATYEPIQSVFDRIDALKQEFFDSVDTTIKSLHTKYE